MERKHSYLKPCRSYNKKTLFCTLHLINSCNLRCKYCYTQSEERDSFFSFEFAKKLIDVLINSSFTHVFFEFHGGEPLLCWKEIKQFVEYSHHEVPIKVSFGIQTNGILLNQEIINFGKKHSISLGISIDGPEKIHNQNRVYSDGKGSFKDVINAIHLLHHNKLNFSTISVIYDPSLCTEILNFFIKQRINNITLCPLSSQGKFIKNAENFDFKEYQRKFAKEHLKVAEQILRNNKNNTFKIIENNLYYIIRSLITQNGKYMCLRSPCGAGRSMIMVDEKGNIYPCEEMYGKNECIITNVKDLDDKSSIDQVLDNSPLIKQIRNRTIENIEKCRKCKWKQFCGGDCTGDSYNLFHSFKREGSLCEYRNIMFENLIQILSEDKKNIIYLTGLGK